MKNERCLIFGGAGSIGSELVRILSKDNEVFIFDIDETRAFDLYEELRQKDKSVYAKIGDVRNKDSVIETFEDFGPTYAFNAAAYKHVTPSGWDPEEYVKINILGTLNILKSAKKSGTKIVNISTDKVVHANSIMGATKRVAEIATREAGQVSVRFGNVMGSRGSVLEIWQRQIDRGESLTVTNENMVRFMMTIPEACELVIKGGEVGEPGSIMVMDMGERINVLKLAQEILGKSGKNLDIKMIGIRPGEVLTEDLMTPEEYAKATKSGNFWIIK